jgi:MerR family regulatory protein
MTNSRRTIGKLAAEAGVGVETIRYYERRGLLQQPPRHGTARNYGDGVTLESVAPREDGVATLVAVKAPGGWRVSAVREQTSATAIHDMQGP